MKARSTPRDDRDVFGAGRGVGVRASATARLSYDLTVVGGDVADVVAGAGGWLCDRVRAGWRVTVVVPATGDSRPLDILGVRSVVAGRQARELPADPAAVAVSARAFEADADLRGHVARMLGQGVAEVTMWGAGDSLAVGRRGDRVQYRLSPAARAFKSHALTAAGLTAAGPTAAGPTAAVAPTEHFHSCALWYPADGPDLVALN